MSRALYPGSFDPVTNGHLDLMRRALRVFDELVVAVAASERKSPLFSLKDRVELLRQVTSDLSNVEVVGFEGLLVEFALGQKVDIIIKGLRAVSDFEYEFQMALMNRKLSPQVETAFLMPSEKYTYLNSTMVKELAGMGADVSALVPPVVQQALRKRFGK